ncbi:MAG: alanyl-tRNA editing protein [Oscillospiraceae bacterium]|nr:alanyl-tRNA editing protein [Oscillospiraceae bacterium]
MTMTEKLFYLDSHQKAFTATVISCEPGKHGYEVVLDRTCFYPEGGGQPGDRGTLGGVQVTDTRERDGEIFHLCDAPLEEGDLVEGILDWDYRFHLMQQHSGEHILSGFIHEAFGYNNVGFHMGADCVTIDFDGPLTAADLRKLEQKANRYIFENHPVQTLIPAQEELAQIPYRSKKELTGEVRIVEFPGADLCACCGVHVKHTGEIGPVKIISSQKFHDGVRLEFLAGEAALGYMFPCCEENKKISGMLSVKPLETSAAAERLCRELADTKFRAGKLEDALFAAKAAVYQDRGDVLLFEEALSPDGVRRLTDAVFKTCGGRAAVFSKTETGYSYAVASKDDIRGFVRDMNEALHGRGGGKPNFCQGSVTATREEIINFFSYR